MISEFQALSDKIDQLAEMTQTLRRENAQLRQANTALVVENISFQRRLGEAHYRVTALLEKIPALDGGALEDALEGSAPESAAQEGAAQAGNIAGVAAPLAAAPAADASAPTPAADVPAAAHGAAIKEATQ